MSTQTRHTLPHAFEDTIDLDFKCLTKLENDVLDARFTPEDILDAPALAQHLNRRDHHDPVATLILGYIHDADAKWLGEAEKANRSPSSASDHDINSLRAFLADILNAALLHDNLDTVCKVAGLHLLKEVQCKHQDMAVASVRRLCANRMWLERAFNGPLPQRQWDNERQLVKEQQWVKKRQWRQPHIVAASGKAGEPWVSFTSDDRLGLALSGGGIRSATINLGLLQALAEKKLLGRFHYLATVSGGGYVGGFWTRWRRARRWPAGSPALSPEIFPKNDSGIGAQERPREIREPRELRHLREFSRFLIPRSGLNTELWAAAVTICSGILPSLLAASAVVFGGIALAALVGGFVLSSTLPYAVGGIWAASISLWLFTCHRRDCDNGTIEQDPVARMHYRLAYAAAGLLAVAVSGGTLYVMQRYTVEPSWVSGWQLYGLKLPNLINALMEWLGQKHMVSDWRLDSGELLRPICPLLLALAVLTFVQMLLARYSRSRTASTRSPHKPNTAPIVEAAWGQAMGRLLSLLAGWSAFAGLWAGAGWMAGQAELYRPALGGSAATLTALFYLVRHWLMQPKVETRASGLIDRIQNFGGGGSNGMLGRLKPLVPQLLAIGAVAIFCLLAALLLHPQPSDPTAVWQGLGWWATGSLATLGIVLWWFDPSSLGLHEFYRSRLARCYLGAGRLGEPPRSDEAQDQADARAWVERAHDDMWLHEDNGLPIHLVCCAGNQTRSSNHLATLHRGARSVVLSRFGISMGRYWKPDIALRLSSAMTASAAAFNSLMGERSVVLGRAVSFVMTALNIRLGLWVPHPAHQDNGRRNWNSLTGRQFFHEMFGSAQCRDNPADQYIHLSDGGHFENLALYELVRRHCRYIVVVDAGEDAQFTFNDMGRAVRRVREDFGVEIEIDLEPIRPDAKGYSKQHLAVGTIHYDGVVGTDKGTIVYLKPSLNGDEPPDILQYKRRKPDFPHETTVDQFFDEAQFESYRRLGEHMANESFRRLENLLYDPAVLADETLFWRLHQVWDRRPPWMENEGGVKLWDNAREFVTNLGTAGTGSHASDTQSAFAEYIGLSPTLKDAEAQQLLLAIEACQLMEEAWVVCQLENNWSHPAASSWMCCLHRWASLSAVRRWWPAIKPLYGEAFQSFAENMFHLQNTKDLPRPEIGLPESNEIGDLTIPLASNHLAAMSPEFNFTQQRDKTVHQLMLELPPSTTARRKLQLGLAIVQETQWSASWMIDDMFVVPQFSNGGYIGVLLEELIRHYSGKHADNGDGKDFRLEVDLGDPASLSGGEQQTLHHQQVALRNRRDFASRRRQTDYIGFYRSRGFRYDAAKWANGRCIGMYLDLPSNPSTSQVSANHRGRRLWLERMESVHKPHPLAAAHTSPAQ